MVEPVTPAQRTRPTPVHSPVGSWSLTRPEQLGPLRRAVAHLAQRRTGDDGSRAADHVVLVVSELATNSLKYGAQPVTVAMSPHGPGWLVDVRDAAVGAVPRLYPHEPGRMGGHGLTIVTRLSTAWGWQVEDDRKSVWAVVPSLPRP